MFLLKGTLIGMMVAIPIGPLGLMAVQRTINRGWKIGFLAAFGAVTSDLIYSSMAVLSIKMVDEFIQRYKVEITGLTGILFMIIGINIFISAVEKRRNEETCERETVHPMFLHFLLGLSNPMTFIIFFAIFTKIGIYADKVGLIQHMLFVISIYLGSCIFWLFTTNIIERTKIGHKLQNFILIDRLIGVAIIILGFVSIMKSIM